MDLRLTVTGPDAADEVRSLHAWLTGEEETRGRTRLVTGVPQPGVLGPAADSVAVALGPGGIPAAVAVSLVAWLHQRSSDVVIRARGRSGKVIELSAKRVRSLDSARLREITHQLAGELDEPDEPGESEPSGP